MYQIDDQRYASEYDDDVTTHVRLQKQHENSVNWDPKVYVDQTTREYADGRIVVGNLFVVLVAEHATGDNECSNQDPATNITRAKVGVGRDDGSICHESYFETCL